MLGDDGGRARILKRRAGVGHHRFLRAQDQLVEFAPAGAIGNLARLHSGMGCHSTCARKKNRQQQTEHPDSQRCLKRLPRVLLEAVAGVIAPRRDSQCGDTKPETREAHAFP